VGAAKRLRGARPARIRRTLVWPPVIAFLVVFLALALLTAPEAPPQAAGASGCMVGSLWNYTSVETADGEPAGQPVIIGQADFKGKPMCHAVHTLTVDGHAVSYDYYFTDKPLDVWAVIASEEYHLSESSA
jgi:hypothetical protein